ncbi:S-layer homology domain-containing protein [Candidatus Peregrinibacteria bacterium]|nr:S-layer homology domain-containing protein [Candidatus Peregrinibacteria bacterium]
MRKHSLLSGIVVGVMAFTMTAQAFPDFELPDFPEFDFPPFLEIVTAVPTPTTDTTPDFTFSSSEAGTISYSGDCSSSTTAAVAGNNTITFDSLGLGSHSNCEIVVTDAVANASTPLVVPSFSVIILFDPGFVFDLVAPTLTLDEGVDSTTTDKTPTIKFTSDEAGTVYYSGLCTSSTTAAVAGSNTVTFSSLEFGTYSACTVRVVDSSGNVSASLAIPEFTVVAPLPPAVATCDTFPDVDLSDPACEAIKYVKSIGAMTGNSDGTFDPDGILQRDQVAKIVLETFGLFAGSDYCDGVNPFGDITVADWSYQYICRAKALEIVTGYLSGPDKGFYRPSRSMNRVEFLAILLRNLPGVPGNDVSSYSDVEVGVWYSGYAKYSKDNGLFAGTKLYPTQYVSREEVAEVIYKLHLDGKI